jgi:hypothetical protein
MERPLVKQVVPDDHGISLTQTDSAAYIETKTIAGKHHSYGQGDEARSQRVGSNQVSAINRRKAALCNHKLTTSHYNHKLAVPDNLWL